MITQQKLKEYLDYNPSTGIFIWKKRLGSWRGVGDIAGSLSGNGYYMISIKRNKYYNHRLAWLYIYGEMPKEIDHINRDRKDNRIVNLRVATRSQNNGNSLRKNKSGYKGVSLVPRKKKNKWGAWIRVKGKSVNIGIFDTAEKAHKAYCDVAETVFGEFAYWEKMDR